MKAPDLAALAVAAAERHRQRQAEADAVVEFVATRRAWRKISAPLLDARRQALGRDPHWTTEEGTDRGDQ